MNKDVLKWWTDYKPLSTHEEDLLRQTRPDTYDVIDPKKLTFYFYLIPVQTITSQTHTLFFEKCATNLINKLFENYVDDDTLVITSSDEHTNVKKCIEKCKNKLVLDFNNEVMNTNLSSVKKILNNYKKVFVYIVGTQISTGQIVPQHFFEKLKHLLDSNNLESKIVIDDVHGLFLFPRDYSLFDFVIFTAHALIEDFDMGVLIAKNNSGFKDGILTCNWAEDYLPMLNVILERREKMFMFRTVMENYFGDLLSKDNFYCLTRTSPHIFSLGMKGIKFSQTTKDLLKRYKIRIEDSGPKTFARFRAQSYIKDPQLLIEGAEKFREILDVLGY